MNRILTYGLAATLVTMLTPPVFAKDHDGGGRGGGGGGRGGGGGAHFSAPARVSAPRASAPRFSAPRVAQAPAMRAPSMRSNVMRAPSAPSVATRAPQMRTAPSIRSQPNAAFAQRNVPTQNIRGRTAPSVAFGGSVNNNATLNARSARTNNFATANRSRTLATRDARSFGVPDQTWRDWDHSRVHEWHNHHFRWFNGDWIIIDPGVPYDYGYYGDDYGAPYSEYTYTSPDSGSLVMSAQDRLTRLGYSPGPVDGVFGAQTRDAIADFQNDNDLPVSGNLDTATVRALGL